MPALLACSPALNWREARFDDAVPLRLLLPCKPDRAEREIAMAGQPVRLQMLGCDADGATFAVSYVDAPDAARAAELLAGWRAAVLGHVQAQPTSEQHWVPPGAWASPQSLRLRATGRDAAGQPVALEAAWFGVARPDGIALFHAVMFSPRARPDTAETFLAGLASAP